MPVVPAAHFVRVTFLQLVGAASVRSGEMAESSCRTYVFGPFVFAERAALLVHERREVGRAFLAAGPVLEPLVENRHARVVDALRVAARCGLVSTVAAAVLAHRACGDE